MYVTNFSATGFAEEIETGVYRRIPGTRSSATTINPASLSGTGPVSDTEKIIVRRFLNYPDLA